MRQTSRCKPVRPLTTNRAELEGRVWCDGGSFPLVLDFAARPPGRAHPRCSTVRDGSRRALRSWGIVGINAQGEITFFAEDRSCPISNGDHCGAVLSSLPHRIQNREGSARNKRRRRQYPLSVTKKRTSTSCNHRQKPTSECQFAEFESSIPRHLRLPCDTITSRVAGSTRGSGRPLPVFQRERRQGLLKRPRENATHPLHDINSVSTAA